MGTFELLNPKIQKVIYNMKWENFRPLQDEAIEYLIKTPSDLIISAPTASGKTEAAFLPIISQIADNGKDSIKILYISPLKALINDQFTRICNLCEKIDFPVTKWHGDANATQKTKLIKNPAGILLITPESLESLFLNKTQHLKSMFQNLEYIVIDEIHSFMESERGTQLRSLIRRLEHNIEINVLKIGLSATINNPEDIAKWLNPDNPESVKIIKDTDNNKEIRGLIKAFIVNEEESEDYAGIAGELFNLIKKDKNLIFANNKMTLETYCDTMQQMAKEQSYPNNFLIHHGSLAKNIREEAEKMLKIKSDISVFCTNTLELGIDIGNINKVVFLAPPFSVASMIQRLGRSGRKENEAKEFRFLIEEKTLNDKTFWKDRFRVDLVQSIAMIELMLEGWCEPLDGNNFDYSTFVHQVLSYLGQTGGAKALNIYNEIGKIAFNSYFSEKDFIQILKSLYDKEIIYQMPDDLIVLNKKGEKIVENYEFYAAFQTPSNWKVIYNGREIGEISSINLISLKEGSHILLAGKRWEVLEMKQQSKAIIVKKAYGKKPIKFDGGIQDIHRKIHQKMQEIYVNKFIPAYISKNTILVLQEAFEQYEIYINQDNSCILPVFEGSKTQRAMELLLPYLGVTPDHIGIGFYVSEGREFLKNKLKAIDFNDLFWERIIQNIPRTNKYLKKFDELLPDEILNKSFMALVLDTKNAENSCRELKLNNMESIL